MPRPQRCRQICSLPEFYTFAPEEEGSDEVVKMTLDELESIRLMDYEGLTQEEAGLQMKVARTTVTAVYESARRKIADCLLNGKRLVISGGAWQLRDQQKILSKLGKKGEKTMRIAVTHENGQVFQHFGHTAEFKIFDVEDGKILKSEVVSTNGQGHGALAGFLKSAGADTLICGGIGGGAQNALKEAGIKLYGGVTGSADDAVSALIAGNLAYNPDVKCDHHGEGHGHGEGHHHGEGHGHGHGEGHSCGNCGGHGNH
ncbi:MAG: DUF134 domain-containing protein [Treponema sp.]|nr:DUF134 domain-containing protein [Treponema sp.]